MILVSNKSVNVSTIFVRGKRQNAILSDDETDSMDTWNLISLPRVVPNEVLRNCEVECAEQSYEMDDSAEIGSKQDEKKKPMAGNSNLKCIY